MKGFDINYDDQQKDFPSDAITVFSTIIMIFRLIKVDIAIHENITMPVKDIPTARWSLNLSIVSMGVHHGTTQDVDAQMISKFCGLWEDFALLIQTKVLNYKHNDVDKFSNLKISMHRFIFAYDRRAGNDAFIDNIVALEALFSKKGDDPRGTTVRIARRIAAYLEGDLRERKKLFCEMVKLYDARGKILHGGETDEINIVTTRDYLIRAYLKYFEFLKQDDFSHTNFIQSLDSATMNLKMKKKNCGNPRHIRNESFDYNLPDFLFQI